jgi:polyferredoxin
LYPSLSIYSIFIGSITGHTLKYAFLGIAIALLTVLFGRFFCGWICPLGATIDASDTVIQTKAKNKQLKKITRIKILILLAALLIAFLGFNATGYSDPITIVYTRYEYFFIHLFHIWGQAIVVGFARICCTRLPVLLL